MNWLLVGVLFTLAFCTIKGYQKGFIRVAFSLVSFFLVIAFVTWAEPYISDYLENNTGIYTAIQEKCEEQLKKSVENGANAEEKEQASQDVENTGEDTGADPNAEEGNEPKSSLEMAGIGTAADRSWDRGGGSVPGKQRSLHPDRGDPCTLYHIRDRVLSCVCDRGSAVKSHIQTVKSGITASGDPWSEQNAWSCRRFYTGNALHMVVLLSDRDLLYQQFWNTNEPVHRSEQSADMAV